MPLYPPPTTTATMNYMVGNRTTKPEDVAYIRAALAQLPEHPSRVVRIMERVDSVNGMVKTNPDGSLVDDGSLWVTRKGESYKSKDPLKLAGTILHESRHTQGADEVAAREAQLQFLRDKKSDPKYVKILEGRLAEERQKIERQALLSQMKK